MVLCDYGCGEEAKFKMKNGKWCCSKSQNSCPGVRKKLSKAKKGKYDGENNPMFGRSGEKSPGFGKIGNKSPSFGRKHTKDELSKMKETHTGERNFQFGKVGKLNLRFRKTYEQIFGRELRKQRCGENNPNFGKFGEEHCCWKGGTSKLPYGFDFTYGLKKQIRERDNYTCQLCFKSGKSVHHIDENKMNCNPTNLITLCKVCNTRISTKNKGIWAVFYRPYFEVIAKGICI